jgi:hypothetical protein
MSVVVTDWRKSWQPYAWVAHHANRQSATSEDHGALRRVEILAGAYFRGVLGCSIVPLQFFAPQRHSQIFFMRAVCASSRVMP